MSAYIKAKDSILDYIVSNQLRPGDKFPTETELSEQLGISRLTLREAFNALKNEGIVHSTQGRGTFLSCSCDNIRDILNNCLSITKMIQESGYTPGMSLFEKELVDANEVVARKLDVPLGTSIVCCTRIRLADGKPVAYTKDYLAPRLTPMFLCVVPGSDFSMDRFVSEDCGIEMGVSLTELIPVAADDFLAECLQVASGTPLMLLQDYVQDVYGNPLIYAEETMKTDAFHFVVRRFG